MTKMVLSNGSISSNVRATPPPSPNAGPERSAPGTMESLEKPDAIPEAGTSRTTCLAPEDPQAVLEYD